MKRNVLGICIVFVLVLSVCFFIGAGILFCDTVEFRLPFVGKTTINTGSPYHNGLSSEALDFGLAYGQEIYAAGDGKVITANYGWNGGCGNLVKIKHTNGYTSIYAHLSEIVVSSGQSVKKGELIGRCGNTGIVIPKPSNDNPHAGKHLHFEVRSSDNQSVKISTLMTGISGLSATGPKSCFQALKDLEQEAERAVQKYNERTSQLDQEWDRLEEQLDQAFTDINERLQQKLEELDQKCTPGEEGYQPELECDELYEQVSKAAEQEAEQAVQEYNQRAAQLAQELDRLEEELDQALAEINARKDKVLKECS